MKVIYIGLSDRIGPLQLTFGKEYDVTEYKSRQKSLNCKTYSLIDDSNNRWVKDKFHYIRRT
jgi:hypothetical protein